MIDLRNSNITDAGMVHLAKLKSLADVQLEKSKATDAGVEAFKGLNLKQINLNYCTSISDVSMDVLGEMKTLEGIQVDYTKLTDKGMEKLAGLTKMKRLRIRGCDVTGEGIAHIAKLTRYAASGTPRFFT